MHLQDVGNCVGGLALGQEQHIKVSLLGETRETSSGSVIRR